MIIGFFRHGLAAPPGAAGADDAKRPLTPEGREKTLLASRGVQRLELGFDKVLTSPLPRALETAEILAKALKLPKPQVSERLLPGTVPRTIIRTVQGLDCKAPVMVGHEPDLSAAVALMIGARPEEPLEIKKAGLAVVQVLSLEPEPRGTLLQLLSPATLRALAR